LIKTPLRSFLVAIGILFSGFSFATDYVFTGDGDWTEPANWLNGVMPTNILTSGDSVYISGQAIIPSCLSCGTISNNGGAIIDIGKGGSLTFRNQAQYSFVRGIIYVNGTMNIETVFEVYSEAYIIVSGTMNVKRWTGNQGTIYILDKGIVNNHAILLSQANPGYQPPAPGKTQIFAGGTLNNFGTFELVNGGTLKNEGTFNNQGTAKLQNGSVNGSGEINSFTVLSGNATIQGDLTNAGTLAPGNSPGLYSVSEDYTATSTAVHNFEVGGVTAGDYDRLNAGGNVYLNGTLNVSLINGFAPSSGNVDLPIFTGTINGTFTTVNLPSQYNLVYNSNTVVLRVASTLPVTFSHVDVKKEGSGARLFWQMHAESNLSRYEVEKSSNGRDFTKIGTVGPVATGRYSFPDPFPFEGVAYYRVKNVDRDGKYSYSIVVTYMQGKSAVPLNVFPSPAKSTIQVQHTAAASNHKLILTAADGRVLQTIFPASGSQKTTLDIAGLKAGIYIIQLHKGAEASVESIRFVKE
jgi:hypothetical protein